MDNLLSEMLLTVETLPDLSVGNAAAANSKQNEVFPMNRASNANERTSPQRAIEENINATNQRSHVQQARNYNFDAYSKNTQDDVSSITTTTLTPTESRCATPSDRHGYFHNEEHFYGYDTDTMMNLHGGSSNKQHHHIDSLRKEHQRQTENLSQNSSQSYMELLQSRSQREQLADHSMIPYHARESSKPFSYGNIPSTAGGVKMHSGLSSPSMVRKTLNQNQNGTTVVQTTTTSVRKIPSHDFEERTKFGRQVESKYTFGDKTPENNNLNVFGDNDKMFDYRTRSENQRGANFNFGSRDIVDSAQFEPLRRSNTMDGSFGRSGYASDG